MRGLDQKKRPRTALKISAVTAPSWFEGTNNQCTKMAKKKNELVKFFLDGANKETTVRSVEIINRNHKSLVSAKRCIYCTYRLKKLFG